MAANYVEVLVKSRDEAKPDLDALKARLEELKKTVAEARAKVDTADGAARLDRLTVKLDELSRKAANPKISMTGAVRAEADIHTVEASLDKLSDKSVDIDTSKAGRSLSDLVRKGGAAGDHTGGSFMGRFGDWLKPSKFQVITTGLSSALAMLPALGAVAGTGMALGLGGVLAAKLPAVSNEFTKFSSNAESALTKAAEPLAKPLIAAMQQVGGFVKTLAPQLSQLFAAAAPAIMPLTKGLEGLVSGLLPGLLAIVKAAQPAIAAFAGLLANLGGNLGKMFSAMAPAVAASATVLAAFGKIINALLPVLGVLGGALAKSLAPAIAAFAQALASLAPVVGVVGKILGQLAAAVLTSLSGALVALAQLIEGLAPSFVVLATVAGQVFNIMENSGVFGVLEDSLESLAGPLAKFINALVSGLAPVLPQIIALIVRLLNDGVVVLTAGILDLIAGLTPLIPALVDMAPYILAIVAAVKAWAIAQAILSAVMDASPIGLIVLAIGALIIATVEVVKHWKAISDVFKHVATDAAHWAEDAYHGVVNWFKRMWTDVEHWAEDGYHGVVNWFKRLGTDSSHWAEDAYHGVVNWFMRMGTDVAHAAEAAYNAVIGAFRRLLTDLGSVNSMIANDTIGFFERMGVDIGHRAEAAVRNLVGWFEWARDGLHNVIAGLIDDVVRYFEQLPGRVLGAISSLGTDLFNAGAKIISMLANGIRSAAGSVTREVKSIASDITSFLPFSPAKQGPMSGGGSPDISGRKIATMLAEGMLGGRTAVSQAATRLAGAAAVGGSSATGGLSAPGAGGTGRAPAPLQLEFTGDTSSAFATAFMLLIREGKIQIKQKAIVA